MQVLGLSFAEICRKYSECKMPFNALQCLTMPFNVGLYTLTPLNYLLDNLNSKSLRYKRTHLLKWKRETKKTKREKKQNCNELIYSCVLNLKFKFCVNVLSELYWNKHNEYLLKGSEAVNETNFVVLNINLNDVGKKVTWSKTVHKK